MKFLPAVIVFVGSFFAFAFLFLAAPVIPDADSYYHLAVAREYAGGGYMEALPWTRFSALGETFGDKELLFHVLLVPFTRWTDAATGGRLALALLNAAFAAVVTALSTRALGWWSTAVPVWLYLAAPMLTFRVIRLRPELLAVIVLLVLIHVASHRRHVLVAALAAIFAMSYTAFHAVIGLSVLWFLLGLDGKRDWKLPAAAVLGTAAGLVLHPGFPDNLRIWWLQNVLFFLEKSRLDVGGEIRPGTIGFLFVANLGWWCGIALLSFFARRSSVPRFLAVAAIVFGGLTLLMQRMAVHFVPLLALTLIAALRPNAPRGRIAIALLGTSILSLPATLGIYRDLIGTDPTWERDYAAFGRAVPQGAKIAAHWGPAEFYSFFAPQGRYLNVLDPIFMAVPYPHHYAAQKRVFDGTEPDVPRVVKESLDSDYIAVTGTGPLDERLRHDPRVVPLYTGYTFLGRVVPENAGAFERDWNEWPSAEAFIDARRVSRQPCVRFTRQETVDAPTRRIYELTAWGRAELRIDHRVHLQLARSTRAILGRGALAPVELRPGRHLLAVTTCADDGGRNGFYLLRR